MRRLLPTLLGLIALAAAVLACLLWLERLFDREHDEALQALEDRRRAVEQYAGVELRRLLAARLDAAEPALQAARKDPLADPTGLYFSVAGQQVVPPGVEEEDVPAQVAQNFGRLRSPAAPPAEPDSPWARRVKLLGELDRALARSDREAISAAVRAFLAERTREPLPLYEDGPFTLVVLEKLDGGPGLSPQLLRVVLRDGLATRDGTLEGLERAVVRRRGQLAQADFELLCRDVSALAQRHQVASADFDARCRETPSLRPLPPPGDGRCLAPVGESLWYLSADGAEVKGVRVELPPLLSELARAMAARGLVGEGDALALAPPSAGLSVDALSPRWASERFAQETHRAEVRFQLKLLVLDGCMLLTFALCAVAVVAQRRKARFLELKSDFVSTVSHELRTPLASLRVMAETLQRRLGGLPEAKDYPERLVAQSDALSFLVENILSFNRLDKDRWVASRQPFALAQAKAWLLEDAQQYREAKVEQEFVGFDSVELSADGELMKLLFLNLLRNACKYSARDPVRLTWEAARRGGEVELKVTDNGVGIPRAEWESVFVDFHRLPGARGRGGGGAGLGLALCRKIARLHQGTLQVGDSGAEGTTFVLRLKA